MCWRRSSINIGDWGFFFFIKSPCEHESAADSRVRHKAEV
jgi:hypothetical protein